MPNFDESDMQAAVEVIASQVRKNILPAFARTALDYSVPEVALRARFDRRYPDGSVGARLPTETENAERRLDAAVAGVLAEYHGLLQFDGRRGFLDGEPITLVAIVRGKNSAVILKHLTLQSEFLSARKLKDRGFRLVPIGKGSLPAEEQPNAD